MNKLLIFTFLLFSFSTLSQEEDGAFLKYNLKLEGCELNLKVSRDILTIDSLIHDRLNLADSSILKYTFIISQIDEKIRIDLFNISDDHGNILCIAEEKSIILKINCAEKMTRYFFPVSIVWSEKDTATQ
jgi:hypothetical protein